MSPLPPITEILDVISRVQRDPSQASEQDARQLLLVFQASCEDSVSSQYEECEEAYLEATDADDLQQDTVLALASLPSAVSTLIAGDAVPALIDCFRSDDQFYELAHALVALCFPRADSHDGHAAFRHSLAQMALSVLSALCENTNLWDLDDTFPARLQQHGLPPTRTGIQQLLEAAAQSG